MLGVAAILVRRGQSARRLDASEAALAGRSLRACESSFPSRRTRLIAKFSRDVLESDTGMLALDAAESDTAWLCLVERLGADGPSLINARRSGRLQLQKLARSLLALPRNDGLRAMWSFGTHEQDDVGPDDGMAMCTGRRSSRGCKRYCKCVSWKHSLSSPVLP